MGSRREQFLAKLELIDEDSEDKYVMEERLASSWGFAKFEGEWYPLSGYSLDERAVDYFWNIKVENNTALCNGEIYTTFHPRTHDVLMVISYFSVPALQRLGGEFTDGNYRYKLAFNSFVGTYIQRTKL